MLKVLDQTHDDNAETTEGAVPTLDEVAREGARRMLAAALDEEVAHYIEAHADSRADGRRLVVRNGHAQSRTVTCGAGTMRVRAPRVNDQRVDDDGKRQRFTSRILPPYMRRSPQVAEVLPLLYLRGLSTGDFREALSVLLGEDAAGLSATNIAALGPPLSRLRAETRHRGAPHQLPARREDDGEPAHQVLPVLPRPDHLVHLVRVLRRLAGAPVGASAGSAGEGARVSRAVRAEAHPPGAPAAQRLGRRGQRRVEASRR